MPHCPTFSSLIRRLQLHYSDKQMEKEYATLMQQTNVENFQMSFYFLVFLLLIPGIPALIDGNYIDVGLTLATSFVLAIIYFWKGIPRGYVQFLAGLIISSFNFCLFILPTSSFASSSKGLMFFRGYAFSGVHVVLLSSFTSLKQKVFFLLYCYAFRFTLIILLDPDSAQSYTIVRHLYIDIFVVYCNFSQEKKGRNVFKSFYDYREELKKFQDLLANYLPQAITVVRNFTEEPLFSNQSFLNLFHQEEEARSSEHGSQRTSTHLTRISDSREGKLILNYLKVDRDAIREAGSLPLKLRNLGNLVFLRDIGNKLIEDKVLGDKPISLSASHSLQNENKSFEIILTKMKWDGEDAIAVILNDTTDQEKIISLKISDANKDKIIATVSHELRTPINGIIGILDMVEKRVRDRKAIEFLGLCKDNAYLLLSLVNSLLDLQQIRQGKLRLNAAKAEVAQIVKDVTRLFAFQCKHKGIYLEVNIARDIPRHICTDENRIKQILINLISNAFKFTSKGGITIEVTQTSPESKYLQFSVTDTGIGIRDEDREKLFKMYEKIENGQAVNKNGVGLGLTISNTLVGILSGKEQENGIKVTSILGQGSKFSFSILKDLEAPIISEEEDKNVQNLNQESEDSYEDMADEEEFRIAKEYPGRVRKISKCLGTIMMEHSLTKQVKLQSTLSLEFKRSTSKCEILAHAFPPSSTKATRHHIVDHVREEDSCSNSSQDKSMEKKNCILAVDDNPFNLLVVENIVNNLGFSLIMAQSGAEAIDIMKNRAKELPRFEVILMDCQMPIMDGFETTRILRDLMKKGEIENVPIVAITANNGEEDIQRCLESGMVGHLSKPLFANALLKTLHTLNE